MGYYIYRYLDKEEIVYIGITNNLNQRNNSHKQKPWYNDNLLFQFIEVPDRYIAKTFETYLINRDNPIFNKAEKNLYDVNLINFNIEEKWLDFKKPIASNSKKKRPIPSRKKDIRSINIINDEFKETLLKNRDKIKRIYYDEHKSLCIHILSMDLYNFEKVPTYVSCITAMHEDNDFHVIITFKSMDISKKLNVESDLKYILVELNVNEMNLDTGYGSKLVSVVENYLDKHYDNLISNGLKIKLFLIKNKTVVTTTLKELFGLGGGVKCVYNTGFGLYFEFRNQKNNKGLLIFFEHVEYENLNSNINDKFGSSCYIIDDKNNWTAIWYIISKENIPCRLLSGYPEYDEEYGTFYIPLSRALKIDASDIMLSDDFIIEDNKVYTSRKELIDIIDKEKEKEPI